jgi:hypothetical protein
LLLRRVADNVRCLTAAPTAGLLVAAFCHAPEPGNATHLVSKSTIAISLPTVGRKRMLKFTLSAEVDAATILRALLYILLVVAPLYLR